jgi:integrase
VALTVAELCERYLEEHARVHKRSRSVEEDERNIRNHLKPLLGLRRVGEVTRADVEHAIRAVREGKTARDEKTRRHGRRIVRGGPVAANRTLALLRTMFNLAERWGLRPDHSNPCRHVKKFPERNRERFLTRDELVRLGEALAEAEASGRESPAAIAALRLLLFTGCRVSEILGLRWAHVDFERGCLRLPESKTGAKVVHLAAPALKVLQGVPRRGRNPYVFRSSRPGKRLADLKGPWHRIRNAAELPDMRLHDLRHSFASVGAAAGLSLPMIGKMLGHKQAATTQRYAHLASDPVKQAVETVAGTIAGVLKGQPAADVVPLRERKRARRK